MVVGWGQWREKAAMRDVQETDIRESAVGLGQRTESTGLPSSPLFALGGRTHPPDVTRFFCPPLMPRIIWLPTTVSAQPCGSNNRSSSIRFIN